jgi:hypothetical protein
VYYEEIVEPRLSSRGDQREDPRGKIVHSSSIIISIEGYPTVDRIYNIIGNQLGYLRPGTKSSYDIGEIVLSETKWIRPVITFGTGRLLFYELRITNYQEL